MDNDINILINDKDLGKRIDQVITEKLRDFSRTRIQNLILGGNVKFNNILIKNQAHRLKNKGSISINIPPIRKTELKSQNIKIDIIYEDNDLIVVNKSAGMVVHPAPGNYQNTLVNALISYCGTSLSGISGVERPGIVHRLDKMTSGLMVVAKNDIAHQNLSEQFKNRTVKKEYRAIVWNELKNKKGKIEKNIVRSKKNRKFMTITDKNEGRNSVTFYELIKEYKITSKSRLSYIKCNILTGRTHQIRVHMNSIGNNLLGDLNYGRKKNIKDLKSLAETIEKDWQNICRHALHSNTLAFIHPVSKKDLYFKSELPDDFKKIIKLLEKNTF